MHAMLLHTAAIVLVLSAEVKSAPPSKMLEEKVKAFEESVLASPAFSKEIKNAIKAGANFSGWPYFIGGSTGAALGGGQEYVTFWLRNSYEKPPYRAFSIPSQAAGAQTLLKMVMFAFEHKQSAWVAVYVKPDDPKQVVYITVYP